MIPARSRNAVKRFGLCMIYCFFIDFFENESFLYSKIPVQIFNSLLVIKKHLAFIFNIQVLPTKILPKMLNELKKAILNI